MFIYHYLFTLVLKSSDGEWPITYKYKINKIQINGRNGLSKEANCRTDLRLVMSTRSSDTSSLFARIEQTERVLVALLRATMHNYIRYFIGCYIRSMFTAKGQLLVFEVFVLCHQEVGLIISHFLQALLPCLQANKKITLFFVVVCRKLLLLSRNPIWRRLELHVFYDAVLS